MATDLESVRLLRSAEVRAYREAMEGVDPVVATAWIAETVVPAARTGPVRVSPRLLAGIVRSVAAGTITRKQGKQVFALANQGDVEAVERLLAAS